MVHPGTRQSGRYDQPNAAPLRRARAAGTEPDRQPTATASTTRTSLVRLQRILLLRELGLGSAGHRRSPGPVSGTRRRHCGRTWNSLEQEQHADLERQIESVNTTLNKTEGGEQLMAEEVFDGFDHTQIQGRGHRAVGQGRLRKRRQLVAVDCPSRTGKRISRAQADIAADFAKAHCSGPGAAASDDVQAITQRQYEWMTGGWQGRTPSRRRLHRHRPDVRRRSAVHCELRQARRRHGVVRP